MAKPCDYLVTDVIAIFNHLITRFNHFMKWLNIKHLLIYISVINTYVIAYHVLTMMTKVLTRKYISIPCDSLVNHVFTCFKMF